MRLPAESARPAFRRHGLIAGGVIAAAAVLAYANSWQAPFVYDDVLAIPENPTLRHLWPLTDVLLPPVEGGLTVSGRPVLNLSFALNHALSGTQVWSYHVVNTLLHAGAGLLLFGLARRTLRRLPAAAGRSPGAPPPSDTLALVIAALWTVHPLQTQAVTYTVQRAESLMGFFYLLTLYAFVRAVSCHPLDDKKQRLPGAAGGLSHPLDDKLNRIPVGMGGFSHPLDDTNPLVPKRGPRFCHLMDDKYAGRRARGGTTAERWRAGRRGGGEAGRWLAVSVAAGALGMGTKEVMATAPLLVLLYDRTFVAGSFAGAWRARRNYYLALAATWLLLGALVLSTGGNRGGTVGLGVGLPIWAYPLTQFKAVAQYLALALWPHPLVFEYGTFWVQRAGDVLPHAVLVLPLLVATALALRYRPAAGFLGAWYFGILAPTSLAPGTIQMIVEHRLYLPSAAVIAGGAWWLYRAGGQRVLTAGALIAVGFAALTARRNQDYRSHRALWSDTVAKRPLNPRAHVGLAEALAEEGRLEEAAQAHREAVRLLPDESHYHYNLALTLAGTGRTEEAERHYRLALSLHPNEARTHNNLGILLVRLGRNAEALPHYAEAARLKPADPLYHYNLGIALMRAERFAEAAASYEAALRLRADHPDAHFNLGTALMRLQRPDAALDHYGHALRLKPQDPDYLATFGGALLISGRPAEALVQFQTLRGTRPDSLEARYGAGNALAALHRTTEAIAQYESLLRLAPQHANGHCKLANALLDGERTADAIPHYQTALGLTPDDAEMQHNLGVAFARLERWDDARQAFEAALRLKPDYADARRSREQLRQVTGR